MRWGVVVTVVALVPLAACGHSGATDHEPRSAPRARGATADFHARAAAACRDVMSGIIVYPNDRRTWTKPFEAFVRDASALRAPASQRDDWSRIIVAFRLLADLRPYGGSSVARAHATHAYRAARPAMRRLDLTSCDEDRSSIVNSADAFRDSVIARCAAERRRPVALLNPDRLRASTIHGIDVSLREMRRYEQLKPPHALAAIWRRTLGGYLQRQRHRFAIERRRLAAGANPRKLLAEEQHRSRRDLQAYGDAAYGFSVYGCYDAARRQERSATRAQRRANHVCAATRVLRRFHADPFPQIAIAASGLRRLARGLEQVDGPHAFQVHYDALARGYLTVYRRLHMLAQDAAHQHVHSLAGLRMLARRDPAATRRLLNETVTFQRTVKRAQARVTSIAKPLRLTKCT